MSFLLLMLEKKVCLFFFFFFFNSVNLLVDLTIMANRTCEISSKTLTAQHKYCRFRVQTITNSTLVGMCKTLPRSSLGAANILYIILSDMTIIAESNSPVGLFASIALNPKSLTAFPPLYSTAYCSNSFLKLFLSIALDCRCTQK